MIRSVTPNRWLVPAVVSAVILVLGVITAVSAKDYAGADDTRSSASQVRQHEDNRGGRAKADNEGKGHGPPSWAHAGNGKHAEKGKSDKASREAAKEEWRKLTPAQREALMDRLAAAHDEGMKDWAKCVLAKGDDCAKPLPPGHAKWRELLRRSG